MSLSSSINGSTLNNTMNNEADQIRILLNKIDNGIDDVKFRSISNLHSKLKNKLIPIKNLQSDYPDLPYSVISFINNYQTISEKEVLRKAIEIINFFGQTKAGCNILLKDYEADRFFVAYKENLRDSPKREALINSLLENLVSSQDYFEETYKPTQTGAYNQSSVGTAHFQTMNQSQYGQTINRSQYGQTLNQSQYGQYDQYPYEEKENNFRASQRSENQSFAQTKEWNNTKNNMSYYDQGNVPEHFDGARAGRTGGFEDPRESFKASRENFGITKENFGVSRPANLGVTNPFVGNLAGTQMIASKPRHLVHVESDELVKLKAEKEDFFPVIFVPLSESDERFLFDVTVRLKYDNKVVKEVVNKQMSSIIKDFPIEALFLQGEMLQELLSLMRKSNEEIQYMLTGISVEILKKIKRTIALYENPYHANQKEAQQSDEFLFTDEKPYIKNSFPTLKPPSVEFTKDPAFKKSQETFHLNYFLMVDGIIDATVDLLDNPNFSDNLNEIWKYTIEIIRKYKYKCPELIQEAAKDYLKRFTKKMQDIDPEKLYNKIEYSYLFNIFYGLFRVFSIEEYKEMQGFKPNAVLEILVKSIYRFIFTEKEVESILNYSQYLMPELYANNEKTMALLGSVIRLKHKELDLLKTDLKEFGGDYKEVQRLADSLEKVLMGVPYTTMPSFVELYLEVYLYSQVIEGITGKQLYGKCREMILNLFHIPNNSLRTTVLEGILENLQGSAQIIYGRERIPKKLVMFQSLLDEEIFTEILFSALENEMTINSAAKILLCFLNNAFSERFDPSKLQYFLNYSTLIHHYVSQAENNSAKTSDAESKYEVLRPVNQAIYKILPQALLKNLLADLFSKDVRRRTLASKYLSDNLFLRKLLSDTSREERIVIEYKEAEAKLREKGDEGLIKNRGGDRDPLDGFLDTASKFFVYKDNAFDVEGEYGGSVVELIKSIETLMKIAGDRGIEYRLRLSSLEQLGEMLQWLIKCYKKPEQIYKKEILGTIEKISMLSLENLVAYCKDRHRERDVGYIGRTVGILNRVISSEDIPGEIAWKMVGEVYDINSSLMKEMALEIMNLLVNLSQQRNENIRYQGLLALNYLGLSIRLPKENLAPVTKSTKGPMTLKFFEEKFFIVGAFEWIEYQSKHKDFWSFLPLQEDANYFVEKHIENAKKLDDPQFSVQDQVLEKKCRDFAANILEESSKKGSVQRSQNDILFTGAERWAKLVATMEFYLPTQLLEVNIFSYLIKVYNSSLTLTNLRADNNVDRITNLLEKLLKSKVLIQEVHNSESLLDNICDFLDFIAGSVLGPLYEIQSENAREKMDIVLSALSLINRFLSFADKSGQVKIKHILTRKVVKQTLIDLLHELSVYFVNNENLHLKIGQLCKNLLKFPEIYEVLNLQPLLGNLFDFIFQCTVVDNFKNKHLQRWFLRFFLKYSLKEENPIQNTVMRNFTQSMSKLSVTSREVVSKSSCFGWLLRICEDRETEIRTCVWNLLCNLINRNIINDYQSSVETALLVLYAPNEAYGVVANAVNYINKTLDLFMNEGGEEDFRGRGTVGSVARSTVGRGFEESGLHMEDLEGENKRKLDKEELLRALYRKNIISRIKGMLESDRCPPIYTGSLVALLRNTCVLNPQKAMPVLSQLEFWDLLVEIANPKTFKKRANGKKLIDWGKESVEVVMLVNNIMQLLIFGMSYDKQVGEYLIYCTHLFKVVIKWLRVTTSIQEKTWYRENSEINFLVDACSATLIQVINLSLFINEDKAIVMVNKLYEEKIEKDSKESTYNVYLLISKLFTTTKNDLLILALFRLIANLLPKWKKGLHLVESKDTNQEILSESLILNLFGHYKLSDIVVNDNKLAWEDYLEAKTTMTSCICTLLYTSNAAKISFMYSGFLTYILNNMVRASETLLLEEVDISRQSVQTKRKTHTSDFDMSVASVTASRFYQPSTPNQSAAYEDIKSYTRILKYFFIEAGVGDQRKEELFRKLDDHIYNIFDSIWKCWKLLSRKEDLFQEITRALCNFASNRQINILCLVKLTDPKSPIFLDVTNTINKFEAADKQLLKISFEFCRNLAHSKEIRNILYKAKVIENCVIKLNKIWNGRKDWTLNNPLITYTLDLFLAISFFKDSHDRILSDASLLDQLLDLSNKAQLKGKIVEKIWILIGNLAYNKSTKHFFLTYEKIFTMALALLNIDEKSLKLKWISTQYFVNILHKCNPAIGLVKKEQIVDSFFYLKSEMERELDKLTFANVGREENEEKIKVVKQILENLSKISLFIKQV